MPYLDELSAGIRLPLTCISVLVLFITALAIAALNRTKHTPETARFLSNVLLVSDFLAVLCYTARRYISETTINVTLQVVGVSMSMTAIFNIGIMSVERLVVFNYPNFYLRHVTIGKTRLVVFSVLSLQLCVYYFIRYGACFIKYPDATQLDLISKCNTTSAGYLYSLLVLTIIICLICYARIFKIIRYQSQRDSQLNSLQSLSFRHSIRQYKATSVVIGYLVVIMTTGVGYILIMSLTVMSGLPSTFLRLPVDVVNILNCSIDPCLYVIWFRECRLEILKMFSCILPYSKKTITKMRHRVHGYIPREFANIRNDANGPKTAFPETDLHI